VFKFKQFPSGNDFFGWKNNIISSAVYEWKLIRDSAITKYHTLTLKMAVGCILPCKR
jgi:hypothetical protein